MRFHCKYDENRDQGTVLEGLDVDLKRAIEEGVVASTGVAGEYNGIEDPSLVQGRVEDIFQAIDLQKSILSSSKTTQSNNSQSTPQGENE